MSRPERPERTPGQLAIDLDGDVAAGRRRVGRVERMVADAVDAAVDAGVVDRQLDAGTAALAIATARAVDRGAHDPYAVAAVARELAQLLDALRLTPAARAAGATPDPAGSVEDWLRRVAEAS